MQVFAGTSGFSYPEWCGRFYPDGLPADQMLRFYSERLPSVEINNTFYRMPKPEMLAGWAEGVPDHFTFALKATRRITHQQRLVDCAEDVAHFFNVAAALGDKLGPVLFQLPPFLKKDLPVLRAFLPLVPAGKRAAFEFRHASWFDEEVYAALREHNVALVSGDLEEVEKSPPRVATADFGYLRLRRLDYEPATIREWGQHIATQSWSDTFAYFKHEALGPLFAEALLATMAGTPMADLSMLRASLPAPSQKPRSSRSKSSKAAPSARAPKAAASTSLAPQATKAPSSSSKAPRARASKAPAERPSRAPKKA